MIAGLYKERLITGRPAQYGALVAMDRADGGRTFAACLFLLSMLTLATARAASGQATQPAAAPAVDPTGTDDTIEAGEADAESPRRRLIRWNEYEGPFFTIRVGWRLALRLRRLFSGRRQQAAVPARVGPTSSATPGSCSRDGFKFKRPVTWSSGLMYDGATDSWLFRETGIMVDGPGALGSRLRRPHQGRLLAQQGHGRAMRAGRWSAPRSAMRRSPSSPTA